MAILRCKMCGGDLVLTPDSTVAECEYCGTVQTVPTVDNEKKLSLFNRAHRLRRLCEFDKAAGVYEQIVAEFPEEAEAYWGLVLCDFGIEYVDDPADGKKIPTCHRSSYASVMENKDYSLALEYADATARKLYRQEAKQIEELRKGILTVSGKEAPYDIFICYKETDDAGNRTLDSVLAQDIYNALTEKGLRVFFSRVSLEDKLGQEYEPYIFAALNSARIMLVVGTDYERFQAVWVKNEWSRFLKLMETDKNRYLIPCFRDIDAYDMPSEFARFQAQDLGKMGAIQDILRGVEKLMPQKKQVTVVQERVVLSENPNTAPLLRRAALFLEDRDWDSADKYCEKVLDMEPENGNAYFGKLMAEYRISRETELERIDPACLNSANYQKALRFGDEALQEKLEGIRKDTVYHAAKKLASRKDGREKANLREAIAQLQTIPGWRDSSQQIEIYRSTIREMEAREEAVRQEQQRREQQERQQRAERRRQAEEKRKQERKKAAEFGHKLKIILSVVCAVLILAILANTVVVPMLTSKQESTSIFTKQETTVPETTKALSPEEVAYAEAETLLANGEIAKAAIAFYKVGDYADARQRSFEIWGTITEQSVISSAYEQISKNKQNVFLTGVKQDGTVTVARSERNPRAEIPFDVSGWSDVVSLHGGTGYLVGLRSDGTILSASWGDAASREVLLEVSGWQDIVWMYQIFNTHYKCNYAIGLKADGTVVTAGTSTNFDLNALSDWTDIAQIYSSGVRNSYVLGLKTDGTVVHIGELRDYYGNKAEIETSGWTNIVDIQAGELNIVGLRADGRVMATGDNRSGQCNVSSWTDVVEIGIGDGGVQNSNGYGIGMYTVGLRSDGTVAVAGYAGDKNDLDSVAQWTDIKTISAASMHVLGLRTDGTVVAAGMNKFGNLKVSDWTDVKQITTGYYFSAGLKSDGTVLLAAHESYASMAKWKNVAYISGTHGWCADGTMLIETGGWSYDLTGWTNMKIPTTPKQPVSFGAEQK